MVEKIGVPESAVYFYSVENKGLEGELREGACTLTYPANLPLVFSITICFNGADQTLGS